MKPSPPLVVLAAALAWNYERHIHHKSTICSCTRPLIPKPVFIGFWAGLTYWLLPHWCEWDKK